MYCTCLHLAVHGCGSIQNQTFYLEKLVGLVTSDHREAEAPVTLLQLRVDEGSFELSWVSGEERLPSCTRGESLSMQLQQFPSFIGASQIGQIKEYKGVYVWLLQGWEVELVGPEGPCRSPGGLERSWLMELLQRNALLSTLLRHSHTQASMDKHSAQSCISMLHMHKHGPTNGPKSTEPNVRRDSGNTQT